ncbi:ABC transporter ATP-binding protein [Paraburkholderia lycopersici]|uniref:NitT/TauT family transport system ATP-binding protein n=1 Tax=Paraburkholderia lycopersici TaxID=416944 RepID=A0A1G6HFH7_9BURK|nr:ABC transporter ATP-binding protein [Paraburkholderia lycopersici]SDB92913.1 NitT/TauT family transport system ATP-binding protein [Paraburkholderia lycopersici]
MVATNEAFADAPRSVARRAGARIDIRHVSHGFALRGEMLPVLDDVSLTVQPGEFVALLGPSGCGKSTLLRLVAGLERPRAGAIEADGAPIAGPDPSRVLVFQDPTLFPWRTVRDNVAVGPQAQGAGRGPNGPDVHARIDAALELVGLSAFAHAWPHQLSGGMAQRAALARGLVNDPAVLALDEPFGKLDSLTRMRMQAELVTLWRRARFSVLFVTHDVEEALVMANRVVVFSERPARIVTEVVNVAPYPRHRDDPALVELRRSVLEQLGLDA